MQPVQQRSTRAGGAGMIIILVCVVLAGAMTLGVWAYWNKKYKRPVAQPEPSKAATEARGPALTTNNNPLARAAGTLSAVSARNEEGQQTSSSMQVPVKTAAPAAPVAPRPATPAQTQRSVATSGPRLQAIFFRPTNPTAVISGKTVGVGQEVEGAKVLEIKRQSVRVQIGSEVRELMMNVK